MSNTNARPVQRSDVSPTGAVDSTTRDALERNYISYLSAINAKDWARVATFAQSTVTHNGKKYSNDEYAHMIDETSSRFKDIEFVAEKIVVDAAKNEISCRIRFEWEKDSFYEHVFYELDDGKIARVWSIVALPDTD